MTLLFKDGLLGPAMYKDSNTALAPEPRPAGAPEHWWDMVLATGTMWTDVAGTTRLTADFETVARVDDRGSAPVNLTQASAPERATMFTGPAAVEAPLFGAGELGAVGVDAGVVEADMTIATIFTINSVAGGTLFAWPAGDNLGLTSSVVNDVGTAGHAEIVLDTEAEVASETLWNGMIHLIDDEAATPHVLDANFSTGTKTSVSASGTAPDAEDTISLGALATAEVDFFGGQIGEVVVWNHVLSAAEIADYKTYTTNKFGIVWT